MLLKQLETLGMVHVPTCLVGPGLVRHSLVPDLLGPALAHHGLELGLASLRASLDHLRVGLGINWRFQLGVRRGLYQRVSRVRPRRVRPVRWQIKGCQTTEPRTFDSGFSGKVNLSTLSFMVHLRTYLLLILGYPLYV